MTEIQRDVRRLCFRLTYFILAISLLTGTWSGTAAAEAGGSTLSKPEAAALPATGGQTERRQRAIGFAAGLGDSVEFELWVESQDVADLIRETYADAHNLHLEAVEQSPVPYLAARLMAERGEGLYRSYPEEAANSDIDRLERCFFQPLYETFQLPCDRSGNGCWLELRLQSRIVATSLFPLQLAIFLENSGYSVKIDGKRFAPILRTLETGDIYEPPLGIIVTYAVPEEKPEKRWVMEDIHLFDCVSVAE